MESLEAELFLGFQVTASIEIGLKRVNPFLIKMFLSEDKDAQNYYLTLFAHNESRYIGKFVGNILNFSQFDFFEANIYSIASRLLTDFNPKAHPLKLVAALRNPLCLKDANF